MDERTRMVVDEDVVVPESSLLRRERPSRYGEVAGLDEKELAGPEELERQVWMAEFKAVLELQREVRRSSIRPDIDESGGLDWGAFGTVDFERTQPRFDKARYKAEKVRERLKEVLITLSVVKERLPGRAKYEVLKYLKMGVLSLEHIANADMLALAKLWLRARRIRSEMVELERASWRRRQRAAAAFLDSLG